MTLYMFRVLATNPPHYQLSKWSDDLSEGQLPADVYTIFRNSCDCPAHIPFCKHLAMAKQLREKGWNLNGLVWDDTNNTFTRFMGAVRAKELYE